MNALWFWQTDGYDTGAIQLIGGVPVALWQFDLRGAIFAGNSPNVAVHDHLTNQNFSTLDAAGHLKFTPPDSWGSRFQDLPDNAFHACAHCTMRPDGWRLCPGCEHNKEVIERLTAELEDY